MNNLSTRVVIWWSTAVTVTLCRIQSFIITQHIENNHEIWWAAHTYDNFKWRTARFGIQQWDLVTGFDLCWPTINILHIIKAHNLIWQKHNFPQQAFAFSMAFHCMTKICIWNILAQHLGAFIRSLHFALSFWDCVQSLINNSLLSNTMHMDRCTLYTAEGLSAHCSTPQKLSGSPLHANDFDKQVTGMPITLQPALLGAET